VKRYTALLAAFGLAIGVCSLARVSSAQSPADFSLGLLFSFRDADEDGAELLIDTREKVIEDDFGTYGNLAVKITNVRGARTFTATAFAGSKKKKTATISITGTVTASGELVFGTYTRSGSFDGQKFTDNGGILLGPNDSGDDDDDDDDDFEKL